MPHKENTMHAVLRLNSFDPAKLTTDNRHFGIVTGYCYGIDGKCPDWVNRTVLV